MCDGAQSDTIRCCNVIDAMINMQIIKFVIRVKGGLYKFITPPKVDEHCGLFARRFMLHMQMLYYWLCHEAVHLPLYSPFRDVCLVLAPVSTFRLFGKS